MLNYLTNTPKMHHGILAILILIASVFKPLCAQNLIKNGSFEQYINCPTDQGQLNYASFWTNPMTGFNFTGTPDFYHSCFNWQSGSIFGLDRPAFSGLGFAGLYLWGAGTESIREYCEGTLTEPLVKNKCYELTIRVSLGKACRFSTNQIGIYFSDSLISGVQNWYPLNLTPQLNLTNLQVFDTSQWTLLKGNYVAHGGERYLVIGNFKDNRMTQTTLTNSAAMSESVYCYLDSVGLSENNSCSVIDTTNVADSIIKVFPNPFSNELTFYEGTSNPSSILLYNAIGQLLLHKTFTSSIKVNTQTLPGGIYFYVIVSNNIIKKKGKLMK